MNGVKVGKSLVIPMHEIKFRYSTSGGPGGQHANKVATRVELAWNVAESNVLGPRQRARLLARLRSRLDASGTLHLASDRRRSQLRNREDVTERLAALVAEALKRPKPRTATAPSAAARERRLHAKRIRSETKRKRRVPQSDD